MIIHKGTKSVETRTGCPNENFGGYENVFVVDDGSELAQKILLNQPYFEFILDENGELINIAPTVRIETPQEPTELEILQQENQILGQQMVDIDLRL